MTLTQILYIVGLALLFGAIRVALDARRDRREADAADRYARAMNILQDQIDRLEVEVNRLQMELVIANRPRPSAESVQDVRHWAGTRPPNHRQQWRNEP